MKTKEELNAIREELKAPGAKLAELTDEEMMQVTGGATCEQKQEQATEPLGTDKAAEAEEAELAAAANKTHNLRRPG